MSFPLLNDLYRVKGLTAGERVVLGYLAHMANRETGQCWPSVETIAEVCEFNGDRGVRKVLASLEDAGHITKISGGGRGHGLKFQVHPKIAKPEPETLNHSSTFKGDKHGTTVPPLEPETLNHSSVNPEPQFHLPIYMEQERTISSNKPVAAAKALRSKQEPKADPRHREIMQAWGPRYQAVNSDAYVMQGAKDGKQLKEFLAVCDESASSILDTAERAWKHAKEDKYSPARFAFSLSGLCTQWNAIRAALQAPTRKSYNAPSNHTQL